MRNTLDERFSWPPIFGLGRTVLEYSLDRLGGRLPSPRRSPSRPRHPHLLPALAITALGLGSVGCGGSPAPLATVPEVDLDRFMGDWKVVALIPNRVEKDPYLSVESYARRDDGRIDITYTFRQGGFEGEPKELTMVARPLDAAGARWKVRPFWPLSLDYRVIDLADDYRYTVIGHPSRNYLWIMARESTLSDADWNAIHVRLEELGYDLDRLVEVPHERPDA